MRGMAKPGFLLVFGAFLAALPILLSGPASAAHPKFYIDGQLHPAFVIDISVNGRPVVHEETGRDIMRAFVKEVDPEAVKAGSNAIVVRYEAVRNVEKDMGTDRSFRFNLRYQSDAGDAKSNRKLMTIRGPMAPFPQTGTAGTIEETFVFER
jgi:hypothetical protein